ncbi:MAG: COG1361 S-layer family protein [Christensenellales bacterium]|jgi:hypothetical protein
MRRKISLALTALLLFACLAPVTALAAGTVVTLLSTNPPVYGNAATVTFRIDTDSELTNVSLIAMINGFHVSSTTLPDTVPAGAAQDFTADVNISPFLAQGTYSLTLRLFYTKGGESSFADLESVTIQKTTPAQTYEPGKPDDDVTGNDLSAIILDPTKESPVVKGKPGERVRLTLNLYNRSALMISNTQVWPKVSTNVEEFPFEITSNNMTRYIGSMPTAGKNSVSFDFTISNKATNGTKIITFIAAYTENGKYYEYPVTVYLTVYGASGDGSEDTTTPLVLAGKDSTGKTVNTPTGDAGNTITVILPIKNRSDKTITNIEIYPQLSADVNTFPFEIGSVSYDRIISSLKAGETADVKYSFKIASKATSGVKAVRYSVIYRDADGAPHQLELVSYVNIRKGYVDNNVITDPDQLVVQPKLLITSYDMPNPLYAGSEFELTFTIKNASETDTVKNLKLTFKSDEGSILPSRGGSNTLFISTLKPGEESSQSITLQAAADASSKAHLLTVSMEYNNAGVNSFTSSEVLTIPIKQQMRVTVDEPVIYVEGATVNMPFYANVTFYNKGKSQLYNVTLKLKSENDTMRLEEGYYGGNMGSGSFNSAEVSIIPLASGDLFGTFVISFEDEEGTVYEIEKEFSVYIQEPMDYSGGMNGGDWGTYEPLPGGMDMGGSSAGLPEWAWYVIGGVGVAGIVVLVAVLRKRAKAKREKELESA